MELERASVQRDIWNILLPMQPHIQQLDGVAFFNKFNVLNRNYILGFFWFFYPTEEAQVSSYVPLDNETLCVLCGWSFQTVVVTSNHVRVSKMRVKRRQTEQRRVGVHACSESSNRAQRSFDTRNRLSHNHRGRFMTQSIF